MTRPLPTPIQREKLIGELLMAFKRLLPKLTDFKQRKKIRHEIEYHKRMFEEAKLASS